MKKEYLAINTNTLDRWNATLEKVMQSRKIHENSSEFASIHSVQHQLGIVKDVACTVPLEFVGDVTKGDVIESLGATFTYDTALPQGWVDDVEDKTGQNPCPHFVWSYQEEGGVWGRPFPITEAGKLILKIYNYLEGRK